MEYVFLGLPAQLFNFISTLMCEYEPEVFTALKEVTTEM